MKTKNDKKTEKKKADKKSECHDGARAESKSVPAQKPGPKRSL